MNKEITIGMLVKMIAEILNIEFQFKIDKQRIRPPKSEVERLMCNNLKMIKNTNWKPEYDLKSGIN